MTTSRYTVLTPLRRDGQRVAPEETVALADAEARPLLRAKAIKPAAGVEAPGDTARPKVAPPDAADASEAPAEAGKKTGGKRAR